MIVRALVATLTLPLLLSAAEPIQVSGVYPHLTMYNNEGECGTGAVVPWAERLWVITYAPHWPLGSSDKLYEITPELEQIIRPESIGGTPANRMIHRESQQLVIGPYLIDKSRRVRAIPYAKMPGRHTGTARHLTDPANKVYVATMEEGLYSVDVRDLSVTEHVKDGNGQAAVGNGVKSELPGYHGKGLYSGQGVLVYANNGEKSAAARSNPTTPSGALASWQGSGDWQLIRRNQFTEVTGPGGIWGNASADDPIWAMGWDARSLVLMLLEGGRWHPYRLPKGSHSYDGAHGWNTEWPRIRDIGEDQLLATMHGTFWRFPKRFGTATSAGIRPRSNYLKVIGDFAAWKGKLVLGCDDSAQKEFLNHRPFKSTKGAPVQSNSNLWFVEPKQLDELGPAIGRGSVWLRDDVAAGAVSDPYLFAGYDHRMVAIHHTTETPVTVTLEVDRQGNGTWAKLRDLTVERAAFHVFDETETGSWIRARCASEVKALTVHFHYRNNDPRSNENDAIFSPIADLTETARTQGVIRSNRRFLSLGTGDAAYRLNAQLQWAVQADAADAAMLADAVQPSTVAITVDDASAIVREDGRTYRIPKNDAYRATAVIQPGKPEAAAKRIEDYLSKSLALGATVKTSSTLKSYAGANAVDGKVDENSRWVSMQKGEKWIELDLGAANRFRSVAVVSGWQKSAQYVAKNFELQLREGGEWRTLPGGKITGNDQVTAVVNLKEPVTARRLRLRSNDDGYVRIYEILVADAPIEVGDDKASADMAMPRICREVATERDLFNFHGTFYELPARNAQGFAKIRPVATHDLAIHDYASHFGLLFLTGLTEKSNDRVFASADGKAVVWAGVIDDLWKLGKPRGQGGPWKDTAVKAGVPSDPYLMTGYDRKTVEIITDRATVVTLEVDVDGTGLWVPYKAFKIAANAPVTHSFPDGFSAYWVRAISSEKATATAWFDYR